jgi:hypothetical protein
MDIIKHKHGYYQISREKFELEGTNYEFAFN